MNLHTKNAHYTPIPNSLSSLPHFRELRVRCGSKKRIGFLFGNVTEKQSIFLIFTFYSERLKIKELFIERDLTPALTRAWAKVA